MVQTFLVTNNVNRAPQGIVGSSSKRTGRTPGGRPLGGHIALGERHRLRRWV